MKLLYSIILLCFITLNSAFANNAYPTLLDLTAKPGNLRTLGEINLFAPIKTDEQNLYFINLRGQSDNQQSQELNVGLGQRILSDNHVMGLYGFFDVRNSANNNRFYQLTAGGEYYSDMIDARANIYIPLNKQEKFTAKNQRVIQNNDSVSIAYSNTEKALYGADLEFGKTLKQTKQYEFKGYLGGYYFNQKDVDPIRGPRARFEYRQYDISQRFEFLPEYSQFIFGLETQSDRARGEQSFAMMKLRLPLNGSGDYNQYSTIQQKMLEPVIRDVDIVTSDLVSTEPALFDDANGNSVSSIAEVGDAVGLYSATSLGKNNGLVVLNNDITTPLENKLKAGQKIVSPGDKVALKTASGVTLDYTIPGNAGAKTITGTLPGSNPIVFNANNAVTVKTKYTASDGSTVENAPLLFVDIVGQPNQAGDILGRSYASLFPAGSRFLLADEGGSSAGETFEDYIIDSDGVIRAKSGATLSEVKIMSVIIKNAANEVIAKSTFRALPKPAIDAAKNVIGASGALANEQFSNNIRLRYGNNYRCSGDTDVFGGAGCSGDEANSKIDYIKNIIDALLKHDNENNGGAIAQRLKENDATMVLFNNDSDKDNSTGVFAIYRNAQDLQANESFVGAIANKGKNAANSARNAAVEELVHLIHNHGITYARPDLQIKLDQATAKALSDGRVTWVDDGAAADSIANNGLGGETSDLDDLPRRDLDDEYFAEAVEAYFNVRGSASYITGASVCASGGIGGSECTGARTARQDLFNNHREIYDIVEEIFGSRETLF